MEPLGAASRPLDVPGKTHCVLALCPICGPAALALCLWAAHAVAADLSVGLPQGGMSADLHLARDEIVLQARNGGQGEVETRLSRIGIAYAEAFAPGFSMGLSGGYLSASQTGQALTGGMRLTGNYAGIDAHGTVGLTDRLHLGLDARFTYHWMDDSRAGQKVQLDWAQAELAATARVAAGGRVSLYAGPVYAVIRVDQRAQGTVAETTEFEGRRTSGWVGGVLVEVDLDGWIGAEIRQGVADGLALSFQRRF